MRTILAAVTAATLLAAPAGPARAGTLCNPAEIGGLFYTTPDPTDTFGRAVALNQGVAVVGTPLANGPVVPEIGAISIYRDDGMGGWTLEADILNPRDSNLQSFGDWVDVSGDVAVASSIPPSTSMPGAVMTFRFNGSTWVFEDSLSVTDSLGTPVNPFGHKFALDGDRLAVQRFGSNTLGNNQIHLYEFDGTLWQPDTVLINPDGDVWDRFGASVDLQGDACVVGSTHWGAGPGTGKGAIHVFRHDGTQWGLEQRVDSPSSRNGELYGEHVAIDGNTIVVAAGDTHVTNLNSEGAAYVVRHDGSQWSNVARLTASDGMPQDQLGRSSVAISGASILVSTAFANGDSTDSGKAYLFREPGGGWSDMTETALLEPDLGSRDGWFGWSVTLEGDVALVGEPNNHEQAFRAGKVWVYDLGCSGGPTAAPVVAARAPSHFAYPNAFRDATTIVYELPAPSRVTLEVFDAAGRLVRRLDDGRERGAGTHRVSWDGRSRAGEAVASGVYFYRIRSGEAAAVGRLVRRR